jgi:hypothetical protein
MNKPLLSDKRLLKRTLKIVTGYAAVSAFLTIVLKPFARMGFLWFR